MENPNLDSNKLLYSKGSLEIFSDHLVVRDKSFQLDSFSGYYKKNKVIWLTLILGIINIIVSLVLFGLGSDSLKTFGLFIMGVFFILSFFYTKDKNFDFYIFSDNETIPYTRLGESRIHNNQSLHLRTLNGKEDVEKLEKVLVNLYPET